MIVRPFPRDVVIFDRPGSDEGEIAACTALGVESERAAAVWRHEDRAPPETPESSAWAKGRDILCTDKCAAAHYHQLRSRKHTAATAETHYDRKRAGAQRHAFTILEGQKQKKDERNSRSKHAISRHNIDGLARQPRDHHNKQQQRSANLSRLENIQTTVQHLSMDGYVAAASNIWPNLDSCNGLAGVSLTARKARWLVAIHL